MMVEKSSEYSEDPLDRLAARSMAAAERSSRQAPVPGRRSLLPWIISTAAVAFALGMIANPWFEASVRSRLPSQFQGVAASASAVQLDGLEARVKALEANKSLGIKGVGAAGEVANSGLATRVATLEAAAEKLANEDTAVDSRMDRLTTDLAASAGASISGQAAVRQLLLLSAARRLVEAGKPLGALEAPIVQSLGPRDRSATDALVAWSAAPIAREGLIVRLAAPVAPAAEPLAVGASWWDRLLARLSGVVQVREVDGKGDGPEVRQSAVAALEAGELGRAIAAMELAKASPVRDLWLSDARRLLAAEEAVDRLEALLLAVPATAAAPGLPLSPPPREQAVTAAPSSPEGAAI